MAAQPLCFVLMPFGRKPDGAGGTVDFDAVYGDLIAPAIRAADLAPLRADEEQVGGMIHKPMFERLILCEYAVADLTTANANVFYELGIRHAVRDWATMLVFAEGRGQLPFDVAPLRAMPYRLSADGKPVDAEASAGILAEKLRRARDASSDSPIFQLLEDYPDIKHTKTDSFREQVNYASVLKQRLADARGENTVAAVKAVESGLGSIADVEAGVVIDLFLSYRAVKAWQEMIGLVERMSPPLAATVMVREQLGLALNRDGQGERAEQVLLDVIEARGPSSETFGILGRVYKDRWEGALKADSTSLARGLLERAIEAYRRGFEADWRDAYPGINAITLMELKEPPDAEREALIPVVRYAVERRIKAAQADYWDYATLLELEVLALNETGAIDALSHALALVRESWEPETTARNLALIREARHRRDRQPAWPAEIEDELRKRAGQ